MNNFVPALEQVNPRCIEEWGGSFGSPQLAIDLIQNPRVRERAYRQMLDQGDLVSDAVFSDVELACLSSFVNDKARLTKLCGLVYHGEHIRGCISKNEFDLITRQYGFDDLKLAISMRELHPSVGGDFDVELSRLGEMVSRSGQACLDCWRAHQSKQVQLRLSLVDDPSSASEPAKLTLESEQIVKIVDHIGMRLAAT